MQQAVYSPDNVGHFGLAYEAYAHFTSPIRRYPDLLIHRAIKAVLNGERYKAGDWNSLGEQCSMTERRADDATRDVTNWLKCFYMQDKIGEVFEGTVAGVTSFGLFVALDGVYVEGLLHVTELGNDYFIYDKARHEMAGERTGVRYRLGDRLTVKLVRVDLETTKIDFTLANKSNELADESKVNSTKSLGANKSSIKDQSAVKSSPKFASPKFEGVGAQSTKADNVKFGEPFGKKPKRGSHASFGDKPVSTSKAGPNKAVPNKGTSETKNKTKTSKPKKVASKATTSKVTTKRKVKK
jgi:ribonuclease R